MVGFDETGLADPRGRFVFASEFDGAAVGAAVAGNGNDEPAAAETKGSGAADAVPAGTIIGATLEALVETGLAWASPVVDWFAVGVASPGFSRTVKNMPATTKTATTPATIKINGERGRATGVSGTLILAVAAVAANADAWIPGDDAIETRTGGAPATTTPPGLTIFVMRSTDIWEEVPP